MRCIPPRLLLNLYSLNNLHNCNECLQACILKNYKFAWPSRRGLLPRTGKEQDAKAPSLNRAADGKSDIHSIKPLPN